MNTLLNLLGIIARFTVSSEEVYNCYPGGKPEAVTGFTSDCRTAILARFRFLGVDHEMDKMFQEFRDRSRRFGYPPNVTMWVTEEGEPYDF